MTPVIIDACVARASGGPAAVHPTASVTRNFLSSMQKAGRSLYYSKDIRVEWKDHASKFAVKWLASMVARKLVDWNSPPALKAARDRLNSFGCSRLDRGIMEKDFHLIDAAAHTCGPIVSLDNEARRCFARYSSSLRLSQGLHWTNPLEEAFQWLRCETCESQIRPLEDYSHGTAPLSLVVRKDIRARRAGRKKTSGVKPPAESAARDCSH